MIEDRSPDHDLLVELKTIVTLEFDNLKKSIKDITDVQNDHESRLRKLEGQLMKLAGIAMVAGAASDIIIRLITKH